MYEKDRRTKTHMEGSAPFLDVGDEDARAGRLVAALDDHDAQTLHPVVNITTIVTTIMFLFVITSLPLCTLNSRLALNFLNSSDSKICKTFIRNDVVDDNVIGDDGDYVDDDNVIDDDGEDLDNDGI